jgi:predicted transposase YdaD
MLLFYHVNRNSSRIQRVWFDRESEHFVWQGRLRERKRSRYRCHFKTREEAIAQLIEWGI